MLATFFKTKEGSLLVGVFHSLKLYVLKRLCRVNSVDALADPLLFEKTRIQGEPVRGCPRNPIDETKLEAWTWQPFYIIKSEWLKPDQCREFYTFPVFLKSHLSSLITNTIHVGEPAAGRANTIDQSRNCCFIDQKVWIVCCCSKQCGNWWWLGASSPDRLFENGLFLYGGTLTNHAFSRLDL